MLKPIVTIRLPPDQADLLMRNIDGWLDAGACDDGLTPAERVALHNAFDQIMKKLLKLGLRTIKSK